MAGSVLTAPWLRGPALLLRRAGVALALFAAALVACLPAAAGGPLLSSARDATLTHQITGNCVFSAGVTIRAGLMFHPPTQQAVLPEPAAQRLTAEQRNAAGRAVDAVPGLSAGVATLVGGVDLRGYGPVILMSRSGFAHHVTTIEGPSGPGLWLPDTVANFMHAHVGGVSASR